MELARVTYFLDDYKELVRSIGQRANKPRG